MRGKLRGILSLVLLSLFLMGYRNSEEDFNNIESSGDYQLRSQLKESSLPMSVYLQAKQRFNELKAKGLVEKDLLIIIDFTKSSKEERLYIVDFSTNKIVKTSLVAHGRNSGEEFATVFSNRINSFQSSLGAYITAETYEGVHGLSLRLDGMDLGLNDQARERNIVIHAADYVSEAFIDKNGRLGRSHGCPALPADGYEELIELIKDGSCVYIYGEDVIASYTNVIR